MRYIMFTILVTIVLFSCNRKDFYGYTCKCVNNTNNTLDTSFTVNREVFGQANFDCEDYEDTANANGKNINCMIQ